MSVVWLTPGQYVIDSASPPDPALVAALPIPAVSRYLGHGKYNVTMTEILNLWSHGIAVILNHENIGTEARQGYDRGVVDGREAFGMAQSFGWKNESPILFSGTDFDVQPREYVACDGYYEGIRDVAENRAPWGPYGKSGYIDHMHDTGLFPGMWPWQSGGWRYGHTSPYAYLLQNFEEVTGWAYPTFSVGVPEDTNLVVRHFPAWGPPKGMDMQYPLWIESGGIVVVSNEPGVWHRVTGGEFYGVLKKNLTDDDVIHVDANTLNELSNAAT